TVEQAISLGWRLVEEVRVCSARPTGVTVSAGLAMVESNRKSEELIGRADSALYAAKAAGKNQFCLFRTDNTELVTIRTEMEWFPRIKSGLREHQFEVSYQPIIALETGRLVCNEALIRYSGTDGDKKLPAQFLPAAERYFLMPEVDQYVLDRVLEYLISNRESRISVNLSGQSISNSGLVKRIKQRLQESGIDPNNLIFEITESVFIENLNRVSELVSDLSSLGCRFWLDDFGTGYSSLSYLRQLPVDTVKIDGSFVRGVTTDPVARSLLKSINDIPHLLGKKTVAEFIDSPSVVPVLRELGIDYAQGFLFGVPRPISVEASR
ncbi:MAG: EAL domain-containing protein, partial [Verrucomicrobia bacterium]|nr:EAL domain-containing protein [Verrucomicrobiota bacterium]